MVVPGKAVNAAPSARWLLVLTVALAGCAGFSASRTGPVAEHGRLQVHGVQLSDAHGSPIQLRGVSLFWINWHEENLRPSAVRYIVREMGANVVRIPVPAFDYKRAPSTYDVQLANIVAWIRSEGAYALIDWHVVDDPSLYQKEALAFWKKTARKYRNDPGVLYEIANEPTGVGWSEIKEYSRSVISEIRDQDTATVIIVGTQEWSRWTKYAADDPIVEDSKGRPVHNIMYTYHGYAGTHGMHKDLDGVLERIPVFSTEWGVSEASGTGRQDWAKSRAFVDYLRTNPHQKVSWCQWSWVDKRESSALLEPGTGGMAWVLSAAGDSCRSWIRDTSVVPAPVQP